MGIWSNSPQLEDNHCCPSETNEFPRFARLAPEYHVALAVHGVERVMHFDRSHKIVQSVLCFGLYPASTQLI